MTIMTEPAVAPRRAAGAFAMIRALSVAAALAAAACIPALALDGPARVIDGDTIQIGAERVRLWGIDAPELGEPCRLEHRGVPGLADDCGRRAADALRRLVEAREVRCTVVDRDRHARLVARCRADGVDLARALVRACLAVDWPYYSGGHYAADQCSDATLQFSPRRDLDRP